MFDHTRLSRIITLALASCAVTWAFAGSAVARPDATIAAATPAPGYKAVPGDTDKAPSAARPPAFKAIVVDVDKTPDRAVVDRNLAALRHDVKGPGVTVAAADDNTDTIALITAIAAMLVALAAVAFIAVRPQHPVLRA
jgi:hypothetical protein